MTDQKCYHAFGVYIQHESENSEVIHNSHDIPARVDSRFTSFSFCPYCGKEIKDILIQEQLDIN